MTAAQTARLAQVRTDAPDVTHRITDDGYLLVTQVDSYDGKEVTAVIYPDGGLHL